jgi:hypothetical protein
LARPPAARYKTTNDSSSRSLKHIGRTLYIGYDVKHGKIRKVGGCCKQT